MAGGGVAFPLNGAVGRLHFQNQVRRLQANPAPQVALLRVLAIEIEVADRRIALRGITSRAVFRPSSQAQAVGVDAGHGAEADAQRQTVAATGIEFQGVQGQVHIGGTAGQSAHQQYANSRRIGRVGVAV